MATAAKTVYPHITKDPGVCSGRPCIQGTRVRVVDILALYNTGLSASEIVKEFTTLSGPADVYAALLYYHDHKSEIEADIRADEALVAEYERDRRGR